MLVQLRTERIIMTKIKLSRRNIIRASLAAGAGLGVASASAKDAAKSVTPPHTAGPFYPIVEQSDKDADLTKFGDADGTALGEIINVEGQVLGDDGNPIAGAVVDIWQANAAGRYDHEADPNTAPLDPNFQSWAIMTTDAEGRYRFKSVKPGVYPATDTWDRPPHIHFKVSKRGYREITTQMYFENEPLNDIDKLLNELPENMRHTLIATQKDEDGPLVFDVVLAVV
jgi:protocatechuate 3,4-dioxygenase beta subunit